MRSSKAWEAASSAYEAVTATGRPAWTRREKPMGAPSSAVTVAAISSRRVSRTEARAVRRRARSFGGVADQAGRAARAARTAASTSAAVPAGTVARTSSVAGLITSMTSVRPGRASRRR
ncbi:hypothetical protein GCM10020221_00820 [Streptomyces thioluteus]|uniref:Uncharacterized protein n=1 Tax=Streptomyces thioluteus TaxID=66431 RepID=A0ABN3WAM9_STRTU